MDDFRMPFHPLSSFQEGHNLAQKTRLELEILLLQFIPRINNPKYGKKNVRSQEWWGDVKHRPDEVFGLVDLGKGSRPENKSRFLGSTEDFCPSNFEKTIVFAFLKAAYPKILQNPH